MPEKTLGDPLYDPIHWRGRQWAVTGFGLQALDGKYSIEARRLWEEDDGWGWEDQMGEKEWVDREDFEEGLRRAREIHSNLRAKPAR